MAHKWHYSQDGAQYGPVDESEIIRLIQDGHLDPGSPVLKEGSDEWQPARKYSCFQVEIYPKKKRFAVIMRCSMKLSVSFGQVLLPGQLTFRAQHRPIAAHSQSGP